MSHAHVWVTLFDLSIYLTSYLFISFIFLHFLLLLTFYFLDVVDYNHAHFRWGAGYPGQEELLHRVWAQRPLHHGSFPWPSNGVLKTSTTMTSPSVRRSSMRAEDEPSTEMRHCHSCLLLLAIFRFLPPTLHLGAFLHRASSHCPPTALVASWYHP